MKRFLAFCILVVLLEQGLCALEPPKPLDAKASGEWIAKLFEVKEGKIYIATRDLDHLWDIRYTLTEGTEVKPLWHSGVIIDPPGLYPVMIALERGFTLKIMSPFYGLMDSVPLDLDPASRDHMKARSIDSAGFRGIAEVLVPYFSKIAAQKPTVFRKHRMGWPSESYLWEAKDFIILMTAYCANDHHGLALTVKRPENEAAELGKEQPTAQEPFKGWGAPISQ